MIGIFQRNGDGRHAVHIDGYVSPHGLRPLDAHDRLIGLGGERDEIEDQIVLFRDVADGSRHALPAAARHKFGDFKPGFAEHIDETPACARRDARADGACLPFLFVDEHAPVLFGRDGQHALLLFDERDALFGDLPRHCGVFRAADDFERALPIGQVVLFVQAKRSFQRQNAGDGFVEAFAGDDALLHAPSHEAEVLFKVLGEEEHIAARGNGERHRPFAGHHRPHARHRGRVGDDQPVEAELAAQQPVQKFGRDQPGTDILVLQGRIEPLRPGGLHDMPDHHGLGARLDGRLVGGAVRLRPFLAGKRVDGCQKMLIPLVDAVAREMLDRSGDAVLLHFLHIRLAEGRDAGGIGAEGARVGDGVVIVIVDVDDGGKRPVDAERGGLFPDDPGKFRGIMHVVRGGDPHLAPDARPRRTRLVEARFEVGGDEHGDLGVGLQPRDRIAQLVEAHRPRHDAPDLETARKIFEVIFVVGIGDEAEQLRDLLLLGHGAKRFVHPCGVFIGEVKGTSFQIRHWIFPFLFSE